VDGAGGVIRRRRRETPVRAIARAAADARGATAIEYALIAGGIALVIIGAIALLGDTLILFYESLAAALSG